MHEVRVYKSVNNYFFLFFAFNCLLAVLQMLETCFVKFNLLSTSIPKSVTESTGEIIELFKSSWFYFLSELIIIARNLYLDLRSLIHIVHFKQVNG